MKALLYLLCLAVSVFWLGCNSTEYRIKKYPERFSQLSPEEQLAVENRTLDIGLSSEAVYFILGNPDERKVRTKEGVNLEIWTYTRIYTKPEGTRHAGYERRVYYDKASKTYRSYFVPRYIHLYSEHEEVVNEIEFIDGRVTAITEYDR